MERKVLKLLHYYLQFEYAPTFSELYMYYPGRISEALFKKNVDNFLKKKKILSAKSKETGEKRYTLGGYSILLNKTFEKERISRNKMLRARKYLKCIEGYESIVFAAFSGSVAVFNADEQADIDLFVVSGEGRMWTARAAVVAAAQIMGVRRGRLDAHTSDKICLNMFMDLKNLKVPKPKQNAFVAREILQMRPVFDKGAIYSRFILENAWIFKFFPNARTSLRASAKQSHPSLLPARRGPAAHQSPKPFRHPDQEIGTGAPSLGLPGSRHPRTWKQLAKSRVTRTVEAVLRRIQLFFINRHKTTEIVTDTQLWFFPDDYEKKVRIGRSQPGQSE